MSSIPSTPSEHLAELIHHSEFEVGHIPVKGTLHNQLTRPLLLIDNIAVGPTPEKQKSTREEQQKTIRYDKLHHLLVTHYRLEKNPFYDKMSRYFIQEIEDEVDHIGLQLGKKYNHRKLRHTMGILYNSPSEDEQLYAYELLTASLNKEDKKQIRVIYNLITSSVLEKSFLYSLSSGGKGLRSIMKDIISEKHYSYSPVLRASAIHVLGQNYVLRVPKEIMLAANSQEPMVEEMAQSVIKFDEDGGHGTLPIGAKWQLLTELQKCKAFRNLGNASLHKLVNTAEKCSSISLNDRHVYLVVGSWVQLGFNGSTNLIGMSDDSILQNELDSFFPSPDTEVLSWNADLFLEIMNT